MLRCSLLDALPLTNYLLCQRQRSFVFCFGKTHNLSRACIWAIFERKYCCILQFFYTKPLTKKRRLDNNILATIHSVINKSAYRASEQSRPRRDESEE